MTLPSMSRGANVPLKQQLLEKYFILYLILFSIKFNVSLGAYLSDPLGVPDPSLGPIALEDDPNLAHILSSPSTGSLTAESWGAEQLLHNTRSNVVNIRKNVSSEQQHTNKDKYKTAKKKRIIPKTGRWRSKTGRGEMGELKRVCLLVLWGSSPPPLPLLCGDGDNHHTCISSSTNACLEGKKFTPYRPEPEWDKRKNRI